MSAWALRRRLIYIAIVISFLALIASSVYLIFYRKPPSCSDGLQNQNELGVDCGGVCKAVCDVEVSPLIKDWTRSFQTADGKYDVASLIENPNFNLGLKELNYTFKLYDADNLFITEKSGKAFVNARDKFVIFEAGLDTGKRIPIKALIEFNKPMVWSRVDPKKNVQPVKLQNKQLTEGQSPKLTAEVMNSSVLDLSDMVVTAVIYDGDGNAIGVSQTFVNYLTKGNSTDISFTWPKPFAVTSPTIDIYPRVDLVE